MLLLLEDRRAPGWSLTACGIGWFLVMAFLVQPALGSGEYPLLPAFAKYGNSAVGVFAGMLSDPVAVLGDLTDRVGFEKLLLLFAPFLFLPLIRIRYLVPILPLLALYLVADTYEMGLGNPQQDVATLPFIIIATAYSLNRLGHLGVNRVLVDRRILFVFVLVASVFFVRDSVSSPYEEPWDWGRRDIVDIARLDASEMIERWDRVLATPVMFPLVAERVTAYVLEDETPIVPDIELVGQVDAVLFDEQSSDWIISEIRAFGTALESLDFEERYSKEGVRLWVVQP